MRGTAVRTGIARLTLGLQVLSLLAVAPAFGTAPRAVSPGRAVSFAMAASACPTFSWAALPGSVEVELVVFAVVGESEPALAAQPALTVRLPGGASSWTPAAEHCLSPGRYAWAVRGQSEGDGEGEVTAAPASWSEALLFEVRERPTTQELENALDVVRRHLATGGVLPSAASDSVAAGTDRRRDVRREPTKNERVEVARGESSDLPERVASAAGSEPNLVLGGTPVARLAASDFRRESDDGMVFDFHNPGAGTMTLQVDGVDVVTTATDQDTTYLPGNQLQLTGTTFDVVEGSGSGLDSDLLDRLDSTAFVTVASDPYVDEGGDTMTGLLTIDPASGFALQTGAGDSIDLGGDVFQGGVALLHTPGSSSTGVGLGALAAVSSGDLNTALGRWALGSTTIGAGNTAIGTYTLDANTSGTNNTAVGTAALGANTTGSANTAVGQTSLFASRKEVAERWVDRVRPLT